MTREADQVEAELAALDAELEALVAEAEEQEAKAVEAERKLTDESAPILAEYAAKHEATTALEKELAETKAALDAQRAKNLALARQSLELDRQDNSCMAEIAEAQALLEKCSRSHGELDANIAKARAECEVEREANRRQADLLQADLQRFAKLRARLLEAAGDPEADRHLKENDAIIAGLRRDWEECMKIVNEGVQPRGAPPAVAAEEVVTRPRRWRMHQATTEAAETEVTSGGEGRGPEAAAIGSKDIKALEAW